MLFTATESGGEAVMFSLEAEFMGKRRERKPKWGRRLRIPERFREGARTRKTGVL
jgi:hypothetical protein